MPLPPMTPLLPAAAAAMASCMAGMLSCLTICCTSMLSQEPRLPAARLPPAPGPPPRPPPRPILPPNEPPWDDFRRSMEFFLPAEDKEKEKMTSERFYFIGAKDVCCIHNRQMEPQAFSLLRKLFIFYHSSFYFSVFKVEP